VHDDAFFRVRFRLAAPPRVSILLPTLGRPELLAPCLRTLLGRTTYPDYEVILIAHDVRDPGGRALIDRHAESPNVRVVPYRGKFNYSAMINAGVAAARGELLCLLNDDTAVISPDWLEEMVGLAVQPGVGCVGAKLLFEDGTIQHCGVTVSRDRTARHVFEGHPDGLPGPLGRLVVPSTFTAVTGACLVVSRADYEAVGGLDAERLRISFNDIDLCLAVARLGRRNLLAPAARLYHYEASSRGFPHTAEERAAELGEAATLRRRNPNLAEDDPFFPSTWTRFYGG
jgi:GT2 family glycosyltransferase